MLAPQYSLRRLLALVTLSAGVCVILAAAAQGKLWAAGVMLAIAGLALLLAVHAALFVCLQALAWLIGSRSSLRSATRATSSEP